MHDITVRIAGFEFRTHRQRKSYTSQTKLIHSQSSCHIFLVSPFFLHFFHFSRFYYVLSYHLFVTSAEHICTSATVPSIISDSRWFPLFICFSCVYFHGGFVSILFDNTARYRKKKTPKIWTQFKVEYVYGRCAVFTIHFFSSSLRCSFTLYLRNETVKKVITI